MTRKPPDANRPRRFRRLRSLAVLSVTALAAPLGLATVATVTTASPAGAVPRTVVVSGDAEGRNLSGSGVLTWQGPGGTGGDFTELKSLITAPGAFGDATFDLTTKPAIADLSAPGALAGVDVFFSSTVSGGYSAAEQTALLDWVRGGGVLIANTNSLAFDVTQFLGTSPSTGGLLTIADPPSHWSSGLRFGPANPCSGAPGTTSCVNDDSAPVPSPAVGSNVLNQGVASIRNWHTFTYFTGGLPAEAVPLFNYSFPCPSGAACLDPATPPATPRYNNNVPAALPVAAYVPFGSTQFGAGSIIMTSDSDTFSNDALGSLQGNDAFATNIFKYIGSHFTSSPAAVVNGGFTPVTPTRIFDTRVGSCTTATKMAAGETRDITVTGTLDCGRGAVNIPPDAAAVALTLTATNQEGGGFMTVFPTGVARTDTSNLNLPPNVRDIANSVAVAVGTGGKVSLYNSAPGNLTDAIVDIVGYWQANTGGFINAVEPGRVFDTRNGFGTTVSKLGPGETRTVQVTGPIPNLGNREVVPAGATGAILNVTATNATTGGFLTVYPTSASSPPDASSVNFPAGKNVPDLVFATLDAQGRVNVRNALGETDVVIDVMGYVASSGSEITPLTPDRLFDNRPSAAKIQPNAVVDLPVIGARPSIPAGTNAVLANVTVDQPSAAGFFTVFPNAGAVPNTSNLNFDEGDTVPNLVLARVGTDGHIRIANVSPQDNNTANMIVDVFAAFTPHVTP